MKTILCVMGAMFISTSIWATTPNRIQPKEDKQTIFVTSVTISNPDQKLANALHYKEAVYYDITCSNGSSAHKSFDSLQAAWDWALTFCQ